MPTAPRGMQEGRRGYYTSSGGGDDEDPADDADWKPACGRNEAGCGRRRRRQSSSGGDDLATLVAEATSDLQRSDHPVLVSWMRNNFLHPYPTAADKKTLAAKSGLRPDQARRFLPPRQAGPFYFYFCMFSGGDTELCVVAAVQVGTWFNNAR